MRLRMDDTAMVRVRHPCVPCDDASSCATSSVLGIFQSLDPKIVHTNDFSYDHFDESFLWDEPVGVRNDDYCVLRDEEWEGPEPPFFVACDDEVRTPPPAGKSSARPHGAVLYI